MALITRFTRLFQADLHAVLDRVEEPDILLKQAVREMQEDIAHDEQRVDSLDHGHRHLLDRQMDLEQSLSQFEEELDVCFTSGKDDLARTLIKRRLETQHTLKNLSHTRRSMEASLNELKTRLVENRGRLEAMRQKADLLLENDMGRQREQCWTVARAVIRDEDVEVAFFTRKAAEEFAMKRPTFFEGVVVAAAASVAGGVLFPVLTSIFAAGAAARLLIAAFSLIYVIYLMRRSAERLGRITALAAWLIMALGAWLMTSSLPLYLLLHVGMIWVIRSLYFHSDFLSSVADLGLSGLSIATAAWAGIQTDSAFLSIWCFFLTQALFAAIPTNMGRNKSRPEPGNDAADRFERAHREAQQALRKVSALH